MESEWVVDQLFRQRYLFQREVDRLEIDIETQPGGGVLSEHLHPGLEGRYRILEGEVRFTVTGETRPTGPGDELVVEPGTRHRFENTGSAPSRLVVQARPPIQLQESIEEGAMTRDGRFAASGEPQKLSALLQSADFSLRCRDTVVLTSPPPALQRVLFGRLAALHRLRHET